MPTLNRFPLLGLWAREAARRLGYAREEAEALGHAYAVLYAIRAQGTGRKEKGKKKAKTKAPAKAPPKEPALELEFCGDCLQITHDEEGRIQGKVGGEAPQTPRSYRTNIVRKFPDDYYTKLQEAFRAALKAHPPRQLKSRRLLYDLYDQWKKSCGVGRMVDLDKLLDWCRRHSRDES